jgi:cell wall-associated NlpC family hydrolase
MADPLADPRARDLLAADPDEAARLAALFRTAASESQSTGAGLGAAQHDTVWTGTAARTFRTAIGRLPAQLDSVRAGFEALASALIAYEDELVSIKPAFASVAAELIALRGHAGAGAEEELAGLDRRAFALLDEFDNARGGCQAAIRAARSGTPSPTVVVGAAVPSAPLPATPPAPLPSAGLPPGTAGERISAMLARAHSLIGTPYVWGGGHGGWGTAGGLDCSGFVSRVLHAAGYLGSPQTTEGLSGQPGLAAGPGRYVTIYDRTSAGANEHVILDLNGHFYEAGGGGAGGAPFVHQFAPSAAYLASFNTMLHPVGL